MLHQVKSGKETRTNLYIGKRVRAARNDIGLRQSDLASMLSIHYVTLCNKELGKHGFTAEELHKIAQATGKPIDYFFPTDDTEENAF